MGKVLLWLLIISLVVGGGYYFFTNNKFSLTGPTSTLFNKKLIAFESQEFKNGDAIPGIYTCDGDDVNPPLTIDRVPGDAKSLVLIMEDEDTTPHFTHWILFNISPGTLNVELASRPPEATSGTNDFGEVGYSGPCPPQGQTHKYYFRIYALDTELTFPGFPGRQEIDNAIKGHIITKGEFFGTYFNRFNPR